MTFIPACAGFCARQHSASDAANVHPRMCGVLPGLSPGAPTARRSSPHVRGFACCAPRSGPPSTFIPACAGFWARRWSMRSRSSVHPRMCGVLRRRGHCARRSARSSPHVRGFGAAAVRRGGYSGSSPHVRGFVHGRPDRRADGGFIPACAGFCCPAILFRASVRVHPRMCGVLSSIVVPHSRSDGSSPHVRGFALDHDDLAVRAGFIPACAGFCRFPLPPYVPRAVHPRMCGVLSAAV